MGQEGRGVSLQLPGKAARRGAGGDPLQEGCLA